jgi:hypothetical protein
VDLTDHSIKEKARWRDDRDGVVHGSHGGTTAREMACAAEIGCEERCEQVDEKRKDGAECPVGGIARRASEDNEFIGALEEHGGRAGKGKGRMTDS